MFIVRVVFVFLFSILMAGCALQQSRVLGRPESLAHTVRFYAPVAESRLMPYFSRAGISYPSSQIAFLVFKQERKLELWARDGRGWHYIKTYPVLAASGDPGPKLHVGDGQVPEGVYRIDELNPHSHYLLSMNVNYPDAFDRYHASLDGRRRLGGNIFIHGNDLSIGCIAIGNIAIEELFVLAYQVGIEHITVIIAPDDLRYKAPPREPYAPRWVPELYRQIDSALRPFENKG
jgi:murein L,D-transpeptidase YafK